MSPGIKGPKSFLNSSPSRPKTPPVLPVKAAPKSDELEFLGHRLGQPESRFDSLCTS